MSCPSFPLAIVHPHPNFVLYFTRKRVEDRPLRILSIFYNILELLAPKNKIVQILSSTWTQNFLLFSSKTEEIECSNIRFKDIEFGCFWWSLLLLTRTFSTTTRTTDWHFEIVRIHEVFIEGLKVWVTRLQVFLIFGDSDWFCYDLKKIGEDTFIRSYLV